MTVMIFVTDFIERCERSHLAGRAEYVFEPARQLNLVDLAGSERQKKTQATGTRLKEGVWLPAFCS